MSQRAALQVKILEKLGAPLVAAVACVAARGDNDPADVKQDAVKTAELLGKAVQVSTRLVSSIGLKGVDEETEAARAAVTALSGRIVADYYRQTGKIPGDNEIARLVQALEATLTFSDNFIASPVFVGRIDQIDTGMVFTDENQLMIQFVNILSPVVNVIAGFSFGKPENALVQEVTDRLTTQAESIAQSCCDDGQDHSLIKLSVLKALSDLYVECHHDGVEKLKAMGAQGSAMPQPMKAVWECFDNRVAMLDFLTKHIMPSSAGGGSVPVQSPAAVSPASAPPAIEPQTAGIAETPVPETVPASSSEAPAVQADPAPQPAAAEPVAGNVNPMSFFKPGAKKTEEGEGDDDISS